MRALPTSTSKLLDADGAPAGGAGVMRPTPFAWLPPSLWTCPRCLTTILTRSPGPRCPRCGAYEDS